MLKKVFYTLLLIILIFLAITFLNRGGSNRNTTGNIKSESAENIADRVQLKLDFGNGKAETSTYEINQDSTALTILKMASEEKDVKLDVQQYDFGVFIKSIDGYESGADMAWIYYVNGESGQVAADKYELKNGDLVEWRYVKPE